MTNFEKITQNPKALYDFIHDYADDSRSSGSECIPCPARALCGRYNHCQDAFVAWLNIE